MAAAEPMADGRRKAVRALVAQPPGTHLRRAGCLCAALAAGRRADPAGRCPAHRQDGQSDPHRQLEMCIRDRYCRDYRARNENATSVMWYTVWDAKTGDLLAVSYTHLDVYKRQTRNRTICS